MDVSQIKAEEHAAEWVDQEPAAKPENEWSWNAECEVDAVGVS